ncbi:FecR family protein [Sphingomonas solaris]|nr:FecR domain-containing protein [Sphingomonas solaris]
MSLADPVLLDAAALWVARTRDASFRDWDAFTAWLEVDPRHNDAYEAALDAHDMVDALAAPREAAVPETDAAYPVTAARRRWHPGWLTAAAAVLVAAVAVPSYLPRHDRYEIATTAGEQRSVRLADGTQIALNGDTRLLLDRANPRSAVLGHGEASFSVVHDTANPFVVTAGGTRIEDVGTTFNVLRGADATDVAVAEGSVLYDPDGAKVKLAAGGTLHDPDGTGVVEVAQVDPATIGAWRKGRLVYRNTPLSTVAADLARATGQRVTVGPDVGAHAFSGTIMFGGVAPSRLFRTVGALTGTYVTRNGDGWRLSSGAGATR